MASSLQCFFHWCIIALKLKRMIVQHIHKLHVFQIFALPFPLNLFISDNTLFIWYRWIYAIIGATDVTKTIPNNLLLDIVFNGLSFAMIYPISVKVSIIPCYLINIHFIPYILLLLKFTGDNTIETKSSVNVTAVYCDTKSVQCPYSATFQPTISYNNLIIKLWFTSMAKSIILRWISKVLM